MQKLSLARVMNRSNRSTADTADDEVIAGDAERSDRPNVDPSPVLQDVGEMIRFAIDNPGKSQVPLLHRGRVTQEEWESMSGAEQSRLRAEALRGV